MKCPSCDNEPMEQDAQDENGDVQYTCPVPECGYAEPERRADDSNDHSAHEE